MPEDQVILEGFTSSVGEQAANDTLQLITCGSVDDGKSTLIGRLLYESKMIFDDQLAALHKDSKKFGTQGEKIDFALLVDGLSAEREQGITIDVAYRYFSTQNRKFIIADTPGHEEYTRNMATGASTASLAVIMVDARKGVLAQTKRHAFIASALGIRQVVLAVNKMDMIEYSQEIFDTIVQEFMPLNSMLGFDSVMPIPLSALMGDNIIDLSVRTPWYDGPPLLSYLENVDAREHAQSPLRLPVQYVIRPNQDYRGYAGRIAGGELQLGQAVKILPSGKKARIKTISIGDMRLKAAGNQESVTVTLEGEHDVSRGDMIVDAASPAAIADQFRTKIIWLCEKPMLPGRSYIFRTETVTVKATATSPQYRINVNDYERMPAETLELNDIGSCNVLLDRKIAFDPYAENRSTGAFILIDPETNATVGAGMIDFALRRSDNIHWQAMDVGKDQRAAAKGQKPCVLWFTGLSGSGKSTIANILEKKLHAMARHTILLDGDNVRHGLNRDLGFTDADRVENVRRVAEVSKLMTDAGLIAIVSFISPFIAERTLAREIMADGDFVEIFVDTPLAEAERRDVKGLYKKARAGKLKNFTGIDSPYEAPRLPEIRLSTMEMDANTAAETILDWMRVKGYI